MIAAKVNPTLSDVERYDLRDAAARLVAARADQGLPPRVDDTSVLATLAALIGEPALKEAESG